MNGYNYLQEDKLTSNNDYAAKVAFDRCMFHNTMPYTDLIFDHFDRDLGMRLMKISFISYRANR